MPTYIKYIGDKDHKKKKMKKLICPICKKELIGREALSRHISHAHNKIDKVKREKIVIDKYFGSGRVKEVIDGYKNRKYSLNGLPINILRYIRLAKIKPFETEKDHEEADAEKTKYKTIDLRESYPVIKVVCHDKNEQITNIGYVYDCLVVDKVKIVFLVTSVLDDAIPFSDVKSYLKSLPSWRELKKTKIFIEFRKKHQKGAKLTQVVKKMKKFPFKDISKDHRERCILFTYDQELEKDNFIDNLVD